MSSALHAPELNLKGAIENREYEKLEEYSKESSDLLLAAWNDENESLLMSRISGVLSTFQRLGKWLRAQDGFFQAIFNLGVLKGTASTLKQVHYYLAKEKENLTDHQKSYRYIPHLAEILKIIAETGPMSHSDLSVALGLNPSTLTECMKKILPFELINVSSFGKYKVYSLTDQGRRYFRQTQGKAVINIKQDGHTDDDHTEYMGFYLKANDTKSDSSDIHEGDKISLKIKEYPGYLEDLIIQNIILDKDEHGTRKRVTARKDWLINDYPNEMPA